MTTASEILETLEQYHIAQENHDLDGMLGAFASDGFVSLSDMQAQLERQIERGAFRERTVDLSECEVYLYRDSALARPVIYHTREGKRFLAYHLTTGEDGTWQIIDSNRSQSIYDGCFDSELTAYAGKVVGARGMLWMRRLPVPIDDVWAAISTKEGLDQWWLTRSVEIDLRPGGLFRHHWTNTIRDFKANEFIDFVEVPGDASSTGELMRFEITPDGEGTLFSFFDAFNGLQNPLILPWVASGWHGTVSALETALTGRDTQNDFGLGGEFYWRYLRTYHKFAAIASGLKTSGDTSDDEWREAYLTEPAHATV